MTRSSHQEMSVKDARAALRAAKLRSTTSRVAVLQHLSTAAKPLSHSEVADELVPTGFDKSTLYRCLVELADAGLLSRLDAGDHSWRFELRRGDGHEGGEHPHFVCTDCGEVSCLPGVAVRITASDMAPRAVASQKVAVQLTGRCNACG